MKKLIAFLFIAALLAAAAGVGGLYYVRPDPTLTLDYDEVPVKERALDMAKRMSFELALSEADVSNVLKRSLALNPRQNKDVEVRGAHFALKGERLVADLNLLWKDRVPVGMQVTYLLSWKDPYLSATVEKVNVKAIGLPADMVENMSVPIGQELPKPLKINSVAFGEGEMVITLKKPNLSDLKDLIGR